MDFSFTKEQIQICKVIEELCDRYLNTDVFLDDKLCRFRKDKWDRVAEAGVLGLPFPQEYGGTGQGMLTTALAIRTFAQKCKDEGLTFSVCAQMTATQVPIWVFGTEEQRQKYLTVLVEGKYIGSSVISEPGVGSDSSAMTTFITKDENFYMLNGVKNFATLAPESDILVVYGKHKNGIRMLDVSSFILEKSKGEYEIGQIFEKTGLRSSPMSEVILKDCKIPKERLLGCERQGMKIFFKAMLWERIMVSAYHVGAMEQQYEEVFKYANQRKQFNKKIIAFEGVYDKLVNMRIKIETSRLMLFKVCEDYDNGNCEMYKASMLKLHTSECKVQNSFDAVNILGAYGYVKESMIEKQMRDSLASKIYSGTSEMQKKIISENLEEIYG